MKLVGSMIVRNELGRYLRESVGSLLEFCDEIAVLDDGSDDGSLEWLQGQSRVRVSTRPHAFYEHEGRARQDLLDLTLVACHPTHVLAIDADEFVSDGRAVRTACETGEHPTYSLNMREVWELDGDCLCVREDGGWRSHPVGILWEVPDRPNRLTMRDRALACGRVPEQAAPARGATVCDILHFGWTNQAARQARYDRYAIHDGGEFHAGSHLESILWDDDRVVLDGIEWPEALAARRSEIAVAADLG